MWKWWVGWRSVEIKWRDEKVGHLRLYSCYDTPLCTTAIHLTSITRQQILIENITSPENLQKLYYNPQTTRYIFLFNML